MKPVCRGHQLSSSSLALVSSVLVCACFSFGCSKPPAGGGAKPEAQSTTTETKAAPTTNPDVKAARERIDALGARARYAPKEGDLLKEIVIQDASNLTSDDLELFAKLKDLQKLQILNFRTLNDEMAAKLSVLSNLNTLALTNSAITDATVQMIVKSFPNLTDLDLSSNTNMTSGVVKIISELGKLQRLTLVQDRVNDIGAQRLSKLQELKALDLRGNMEAGDMTLEVVGELPHLVGFKHRSTAVNDPGMEALSRSQNLESLLIQDFAISDQSGPSLAKLTKLSQLEIFRCQGFGTEGVLALKGLGLTRLTLRDLPNVDNRAMEVLDDLPKLKRLYLHELPSVGDAGLQHLAALKSLEVLDIWTVPQMTDATLDVLAGLPNLKELSLRASGVTDAGVEKLLKLPALQSLIFKENGNVSAEAVKKLNTRKWTKLDLGHAPPSEPGDAA